MVDIVHYLSTLHWDSLSKSVGSYNWDSKLGMEYNIHFH